jgi:hypothetical protein
MAIREEQGTQLSKAAVKNFSFFVNKIRVLLVAGTVQPKPKAKGIIALPGRLNRLKNLSKLTTYLESSPTSSISVKRI